MYYSLYYHTCCPVSYFLKNYYWYATLGSLQRKLKSILTTNCICLSETKHSNTQPFTRKSASYNALLNHFQVLNLHNYSRPTTVLKLFLQSNLLTYSMEQSPLWKANKLVKKLPTFYRTKGSLPHSQLSATCPYPRPASSSPNPHIPLPKDLSLYYPPIYAWVSQVASFRQVSPPKPCMHHFTCFMYRPSHSSHFDHPNYIWWVQII